MARARNIKPSFFSNDDLADMDPLGRLLFIGLWTLADREGRLEDRPRRIKAEVLPYDDCNTDELLEALHKHGFIQRYSVGEERFIQVLSFTKHQNPHMKEAASLIPAHDAGDASTIQEQCDIEPLPEQAGLNPDSPFPLIDSPSLNPENKEAGASAPSDVSKVEPKRVSAKPKESLPDWLPARAWADWVSFKGKKLTAKARYLNLKTLTDLHADGHDPTAVIEQSIERGWTGLFPIKKLIASGATQHGNFAKQDYRAGLGADGSF